MQRFLGVDKRIAAGQIAVINVTAAVPLCPGRARLRL